MSALITIIIHSLLKLRENVECYIYIYVHWTKPSHGKYNACIHTTTVSQMHALFQIAETRIYAEWMWLD